MINNLIKYKINVSWIKNNLKVRKKIQMLKRGKKIIKNTNNTDNKLIQKI